MFKKVLFFIVLVLLIIPGKAWPVEVYRDGDMSLDIGFWLQGWYQWVEDAKDGDGDGIEDEEINDFVIRRAYLPIHGTITPRLDFFVNLAADKIGMDGGVDDSGLGLGSGFAVRDLWGRIKLADEALMFNIGRMYVPLTRTPDEKAFLAIDFDWTQDGSRGEAFFPSKVNRDEGVMLWGNLADDVLRYRLMVADGVEANETLPAPDFTTNPDDNLRFVGRVSVSLLDPEKEFFNPQTYLGEKSVLSIGAGIDFQEDLIMGIGANRRERDYTAWTVDLHYDQPIGDGGLTLEAAYIDINNGPNEINFTRMEPGFDATIASAKAGYFFPVGLQPVVHWEKLNMKNGLDDTNFYGGGINYYIKGHANKISLDVTQVDQEREDTDFQDHLIVTAQIAIGF